MSIRATSLALGARSTTRATTGRSVAAPALAAAGAWTHLCGVWDKATSKMMQFVDGALAGSQTATGIHAPGAFNIVGAQIVQERTTAIGVNAGLVVAPHSRVTGQYGVQAFDVVYDVQTVRAWPAIPNRIERCFDQGAQRGTTNAPTLTEGWRFIAG